MSVVENGVETDLFRPCPPQRVPGTEGRFVVCYIGTMGMAHGLGMLIEAAEQLQRMLPSAVFLLIGEGAEKEHLVQLASARGLNNITFLGQQPRENIPAYISGADACLVMLKKTELFKTVIPTKLLEYMACEKPVIAAVDGQTRGLVETARAGIFVEPESSRILVEAITALASDPDRRKAMGAAGRSFIVTQLSRESTARSYLAVLSAVRNRWVSAP
jgi:glycosyltransferase involved in cell wall biosynthesis